MLTNGTHIFNRLKVLNLAVLLLASVGLSAETTDEAPSRKSVLSAEEYSILSLGGTRFDDRIGISGMAGRVAGSDKFLQGDNAVGKEINFTQSVHLKYSAKAGKGSREDISFGGVYQGLGVSKSFFGNKRELGDPWSVYLLQGGRIVSFTPKLALLYEWNFGISGGWEPYDVEKNPYNRSIGSEINAYLAANFYFNYNLTDRFDLGAGVSLSHYSNGNTRHPNNGVNSVSGHIDLTYNFSRTAARADIANGDVFRQIKHPRHMSYEFLVFGSWKRRGIMLENEEFANNNSKRFAIAGVSFTPMYSLSHRLKAGVSADFVYDASSKVVYEHDREYSSPATSEQLSLGFSGKLDYTMPYFTISAGVGYEVIHSSDEYRPFYQTLSLKINAADGVFFNIGYRIRNFSMPNFLMLGIGIRFTGYR